MKKTNKTVTPMMDKRQARVKLTAECFTPEWLVTEMMDKLKEYGPESWEPNKTFLDPACGDGGLLVPVLKRKLSLGHNPNDALKTIFGCDILQDNIKECRLRLLKVLQDFNVKITDEHVKTIFKNIVCTPLSKYKNGSLDYDFEFDASINQKDVTRWMEGIRNNNWLDLVGNEDINAIIRNEITCEVADKFHSFMS